MSGSQLRNLSFVASFVSLGILLSSGCVSENKQIKPATQRTSAEGPIVELNLLAAPMALNMDESPGPDGFLVKVYANDRKHPKPVPIEEGKLEILMFDGSPGLSGNELAKPLRVWTLTVGDLKPYEIRTSIGAGYELIPKWGEAKPTSGRFTIIVRYISPGGGIVNSAPSIISMGVR